MRWNGRHGLTALEQVRQRREMRGRGAHPATQTLRCQPFIGDADEAARRHQNVFTGNKLLKADVLLALGQARRVCQTQITAFTQYLSAEQSLGEPACGNGQVDAALHQGLGDDLAVGLAENQTQFRCAQVDLFDQAAAVGNFEIIR
ncbi:hypothetical protein D3C81_1643580 [compost metagenome]